MGIRNIHHINCGTLLVRGYPTVVCHRLLLEDTNGLALIDTGIGLLDVQNSVERLGQELIDLAGFQFNEPDTTVRKLESLGFSPDQLGQITLTHCDPDHVGGLADFPDAQVHTAMEEQAHALPGHWRYVPRQFEQNPCWQKYGSSTQSWFGLEARPINLGFTSEVLLIPLFGHTLGHCCVAIQQGDRWLLHVGDAYSLRAELTEDDHPVSAMAAQRADDHKLRRSSFSELRRLLSDCEEQSTMFGCHDIIELQTTD